MKRIFRFKKILHIILIFVLTIGCTPSSNAQRYGGSKEKQSKTKASTRFKTEKPQQSKVKETVNTLPDSTDDEEFDEAPPQESTLDKKQFISNYKNYINPDVPLGFREEILLQIIKFIDTPYKYGGNTENGIDCSGFTKQVFYNALQINLPRSAKEQYTIGENVEREDLSFGDLVFFNTRRRSNPGHVGIFIGDNQFIHASRTLGVTISSLKETYYDKRYTGARRVEDNSDFH